MKYLKLLVLVLVCSLGIALLWQTTGIGPTTRVTHRATFVGAMTCSECHQKEWDEWRGSDHERAMALATPENIRGDFNNAVFSKNGLTSRFTRKGDKFLVTTDNRDGKLETFGIKYTFGWRPLQQYLVQFQDGRVQALPFCWETRKKRWFHIYPDETIDHTDPLHWTGPMQNWDHMCAECHSTNVQKKYDANGRRFDTTFSEINVACEACHGPGGLHVEIARSQWSFWKWRGGYALSSVGANSRKQIETCAPCHSRRTVIQPGFRAGDNYYDHYLPELLVPYDPGIGQPAYFPDGQIDGEVYVYGSFIQSKMYHKNVRCTDCHRAHTAKLRLQGNALCMRCHVPTSENPTLYNTSAHLRHDPGTPGSFCVDCHMPAKNYMVVDPRRDHSLRVPRPDLSIELGTPNACNSCHQDKDSRWAADQVTEWYGPRRPPDRHHARTIAAARRGQPSAEAKLALLANNPESSMFLRASAFLLLRQYQGDSGYEAASRALEDPDALVRVAAIAKLEALNPHRTRDPLLARLKDPRTSVRLEAARLLSRLPDSSFNEYQRNVLELNLSELQGNYLANLDRPESHLGLAILAGNQGRPVEAARWYRSAISTDPSFVPARMNLATLLSQRGKNGQAEKLLREVIRLQPEWGEGYYSLGLLIAEDSSRLVEAAGLLKSATRRMPRHARARYNYALCLWKLRKMKKAAGVLEAAVQLGPRQADFVQALAQLYAQQGQWRRALPYARKSLELVPKDPERFRFLQQIEQRAHLEEKFNSK